MNGQYFQTAMKTPSSDALEEFMRLNGRYSNFTKETFFVRYISKGSCAQDLVSLHTWNDQSAAQRLGCVFVQSIKSQPPASDIGKYMDLYHNGDVRLPFRFENRIWQESFERSFARIIELFKEVRGRSEESIVRNFTIKLLYWIDTYFPMLFVETSKMTRFPKFACGGTIKLPEYLFLYLLFLLGCDVLYISPTEDVSVNSPELLSHSLRVEAGPAQAPAPRRGPEVPSNGRAVISIDRVRRSDRHTPPPPARTATPPSAPAPSAPPAPSLPRPGRQPMEFEELAKFASSVVMIKVFDQNDQCIKTGSGVIISGKGYVLTNLHVVNGGHYYGILLEEETDVFYTNELIKYHQDYDLAVLRMEKRRTPIPIADRNTRLVRGQKVVAIGSPLGLFNSVSDGIISGFRNMERVSMIQFTAPVSHGSSGGALLDMYGNLIGLITAGFDDGQNLNLAVDHQTIFQFVRGLL